MPQEAIAYLGPQGTYSEEAALVLLNGQNDPGQLLPYPSIEAVIRAVGSGEVRTGIVPLENSLEGSVNITLDTLAHDVDVLIVREMILPIRHYLLVRDNNAPISSILSHPQALAQCRHYIALHHPAAQIKTVDSTAAAAKLVATGSIGYAAVAGYQAASYYGLTVKAENIQDNHHNCTRFVVLSKQAVPEQRKNKTSVVCRILGDKPGALCNILLEFANRDVNLTRIESRPARTGLGEYIFFFDIDGAIDEPNIVEAIDAVTKKSLWMKNLGSYPVSIIK